MAKFLAHTIITSMKILMITSKNWLFNHFFLDISVFLSNYTINSIFFIKFTDKQQKSIMAKLNRIRVVLAERDLNNK